MSKKNKRGVGGSNLFKIFIKLFIIAIFLLSGGFALWASSLSVPELDSLEKRKITRSTKIYDRTGKILLYDVHENIQRTIVSFSKISRKLKEWVLALKLERKFSKEKILELYLNESPYGGSIYGIEEASNMFFAKNSAELTLAESAYLAALPQAPTFYSPYGNNKNKLEERKNLVLQRMFENSFITKDEYDSALEEFVGFKPQRDIGINAPHFVFFVIEYLENKYGRRAVEEKGFKVITTLNFELQKKAEEIIFKYAHENEEKFNAENAGLVAIDPKTGQILVMVGSRDYFDEEIDGNFNVAINANRQPGSAFKPFVYATAFSKGYTPETTVFNLKTQFQTTCTT